MDIEFFHWGFYDRISWPIRVIGDGARSGAETDRAALLRGGKRLNRLDKGHPWAFWIEALEAPHLYVQHHRTTRAGLDPELAPILAIPARTAT